MSEPARVQRPWTDGLLVRTDTFDLRTDRPVQILDLTPRLAERVRASGLRTGLVSVQVLHTTAGLLLNEREPLLFEDLQRTLERVAPRDVAYRHDDLARRVPPPPPDERPNGHAHCRAMVLRASESLNVEDGALVLGRWQRLLLVELDGPRTRHLSLALIGSGR